MPVRSAACARAVFVVLTSLTAMPSGHAEDASTHPNLWIVTVGGWATLEPSAEGATSLRAAGRPLLGWRRADSKDWMVLPNDGFDFDLIETGTFRAGPVASWSWMRSGTLLPRGYRRALGFGDLSLEAGVFAEYWPADWLRTRAEVRDSVWGGKGWIAELNVDGVWRPAQDLTITGGPRVSLADGQFMATYYGVTPEQSAMSNLPLYSSSPGLRSVGAGAAVKRDWTPGWSTMTFVEYERLVGAAGDSPLLDAHGTAHQATVGVGASYSFTYQR